MGVQKKSRKFAQAKRAISLRDNRLKESEKTDKKGKTGKDDVTAGSIVAFLPIQHGSGPPPYSVLVDTNFISHTIQHKLEVIPTMMDCLYAKCIPVITDCVLAELEKLGQKYRLALRVAKDPRFERIRCDHKGTYADDCLVDRVIKHRVYIVATNDRDLKRRIRKIPGAPIMSVARGKYVIERLPDAPEK
ncbi:rRNA-processing protein FCF1 [Penicillium atrosanguineum]|uniref:rRNA-processing protein FCF1 n=1 Tax=Penicillium atrosanguineum TaxID=1132637 RepID=A0A9W9PLK2_9EURO|nr:rRNA-processing protein FCF1 [Penicillium atrosanguineum]